MNKLDRCKGILAEVPLDQWDSYLMKESNLPGPRANLELASAAADLASEDQAKHWLEEDQPELGSDDPRSFLAFCAAITLGRLIGEGHVSGLSTLRELASDQRWRIREAVAMALQRIGDTDSSLLFDIAEDWARGSLLEARAAAAGVAEPRLLKAAENAPRAVRVMDLATRRFSEAPAPKSEGYQTLKQGLSYCWSVVAAAYPEETKPAMEVWFRSPTKDVRQVMKENLKKNRLAKAEPEWTAVWLKRLG